MSTKDGIIWSGTLARGGRVATPFKTQIVEHEGRLVLIEGSGIEGKVVSPAEVSGASWLNALATLANEKAGSHGA